MCSQPNPFQNNFSIQLFLTHKYIVYREAFPQSTIFQSGSIQSFDRIIIDQKFEMKNMKIYNLFMIFNYTVFLIKIIF